MPTVEGALQWRMPRDPFIREKFTRERSAARKLAQEYFERFPKDRYQTVIENWRHPLDKSRRTDAIYQSGELGAFDAA